MKSYIQGLITGGLLGILWFIMEYFLVTFSHKLFFVTKYQLREMIYAS